MSETPAETASEQTAVAASSDSEYYRLLADDRRRAVLDALAERDGATTVSELARAVTERQTDGESAETAIVALHHVHLPMLDDFDCVDYDREARRVDPDDAAIDRLTS